VGGGSGGKKISLEGGLGEEELRGFDGKLYTLKDSIKERLEKPQSTEEVDTCTYET